MMERGASLSRGLPLILLSLLLFQYYHHSSSNKQLFVSGAAGQSNCSDKVRKYFLEAWDFSVDHEKDTPGRVPALIGKLNDLMFAKGTLSYVQNGTAQNQAVFSGYRNLSNSTGLVTDWLDGDFFVRYQQMTSESTNPARALSSMIITVDAAKNISRCANSTPDDLSCITNLFWLDGGTTAICGPASRQVSPMSSLEIANEYNITWRYLNDVDQGYSNCDGLVLQTNKQVIQSAYQLPQALTSVVSYDSNNPSRLFTQNIPFGTLNRTSVVAPHPPTLHIFDWFAVQGSQYNGVVLFFGMWGTALDEDDLFDLTFNECCLIPGGNGTCSFYIPQVESRPVSCNASLSPSPSSSTPDDIPCIDEIEEVTGTITGSGELLSTSSATTTMTSGAYLTGGGGTSSSSSSSNGTVTVPIQVIISPSGAANVSAQLFIDLRFQFILSGIQEIDGAGNVVKEVTEFPQQFDQITNKTSTSISDQEIDSLFFIGGHLKYFPDAVNLEHPIRPLLGMNFYYYTLADKFNFSGEVINISANTIKVIYNISDWTFSDPANRLRVITQSKTESNICNNRVEAPASSNQNNNGYFDIITLVEGGGQFRSKFFSKVDIDGTLTDNTTLTFDKETSQYLFSFPSFQEYALLDPQLGILFDPDSPKKGCGTNGFSTRSIAIIAGTVGGAFLIVILAIIILLILLKKGKAQTLFQVRENLVTGEFSQGYKD